MFVLCKEWKFKSCFQVNAFVKLTCVLQVEFSPSLLEGQFLAVLHQTALVCAVRSARSYLIGNFVPELTCCLRWRSVEPRVCVDPRSSRQRRHNNGGKRPPRLGQGRKFRSRGVHHHFRGRRQPLRTACKAQGAARARLEEEDKHTDLVNTKRQQIECLKSLLQTELAAKLS